MELQVYRENPNLLIIVLLDANGQKQGCFKTLPREQDKMIAENLDGKFILTLPVRSAAYGH